MKRKKFILIILLCLLIGIIYAKFLVFKKNEKTVNFDVISDYLEIKISENAKIEYRDEHDSFFNEGFTIMKITDENLYFRQVKQAVGGTRGRHNRFLRRCPSGPSFFA